MRKRKNPDIVSISEFLGGGEGGIRTHGPVISRFTRFRVGAVMTASILLQNLSQHRLSEKGEN